MKKRFSNRDIYNYAQLLSQEFLNNDIEVILPIKVNFSLQKNIRLFINAAEEIEQSRQAIGRKYGTSIDSGYQIPEDKVAIAQKEMNDLLEIEQNLEILTISLDALDNVTLTTRQMQAMLFMIDD